MLDFQTRKETVINAPPEAVFDILADVQRHVELAGSGELKTVRKVGEGAVGLGTAFDVDETVRVGDQGMDLTTRSFMVTCDRPKCLSWIVTSPLPLRRVQWWFNLTPEGSGTRVSHEVEVDIGEPPDPQVKALKENYDQIRAPYVIAGMEKTLENLRKALEK